MRLKHENHLALLALASAAPAMVVAIAFVWAREYSPFIRWGVVTIVFLSASAGLALLRSRARFPLRTLSNLVAAMREGDFSTRARTTTSSDAMGELAAEINALAVHLRDQRLDSVEAAALLRTIMAEIDVAVFAFDPARKLTLANRSAEQILQRAAEQMLGRSAAELGLEECLEGASNRMLSRTFPGGGERWSMRRGRFRQLGMEHQLIVLTDLSPALREEERLAWQRLLRVLGHEINNSLAPIKSIATSLEDLVSRDPKPDDWLDDLGSGLAVIKSRSEALTRFTGAYSNLAKVPPPRFQKVELKPLFQRLVRLEQRRQIQLGDGPDLALQADPDQLEQVMINLLRNAVEAVLESRNDRDAIQLNWSIKNQYVEVTVQDDGRGLANDSNLFVPFFTTKPNGSGIGLFLSRQIAEAHGGSLTLENRSDHPGCVARLRLPL